MRFNNGGSGSFVSSEGLVLTNHHILMDGWSLPVLVQELLELGSWTKAKDAGALRVEGKDYVVRDGDVLEIRFNV